MARQSRAAVRAAQRRKIKKARDGRRETVAGEGVLERIRKHLEDEGFAVSGVTDGSGGSVTALELEFSVRVASDAAGGGLEVMHIPIGVVPENKTGCITIMAPDGWDLGGVSAEIRSMVKGKILTPRRSLPVGIMLEDVCGTVVPCVNVWMSAERLPEAVSSVVMRVLRYVAFVDASVRRVIQAGIWLEPEARELDGDALRNISQELVCRFEKEGQSRLEALVKRGAPLLKQIEHQMTSGTQTEVVVIRESPFSELFSKVPYANVVFIVEGHVTSRVTTRNLDYMERKLCELEAIAGELEAQTATTD